MNSIKNLCLNLTIILLLTPLCTGGEQLSEKGPSNDPHAIYTFKTFPDKELKHPVLVQRYSSNTERLKKSMAEFMKLSDQAVASLVPKQNGFRWVPCPNCSFNTGENFSWTAQKPNEIKCPDCNITLPSKKYPPLGFVMGEAPSGKPQKFTYYKSKSGKKHYIEARVNYEKINTLMFIAKKLGLLYQKTKDERYANTGAILLCEFAKNFHCHPMALEKLKYCR